MGGRNTKFFDETPGVFDNLVFEKSLRGECVVDIDCQIAKDPILRPLVEKYANDQNAFFVDFVAAYIKMMRQTPDAPQLTPESLLTIPDHPGVQQEGTVANAKPHNELDFDAEDQEIEDYQRVTGKRVTRRPNGTPYNSRPSTSTNRTSTRSPVTVLVSKGIPIETINLCMSLLSSLWIIVI